MARSAEAPAENSGTNSGTRDDGLPVGKPFQKGRSGNPAGRPKGLAKATRDLLDEAALEVAGRTGADVLVMFWSGVMSDPKADMGHRLKASQFLSERGWGKPPAFAPVEDEDPLDLSEEEAEAVAAGFDEAMDELAERRRAAAKSAS